MATMNELADRLEAGAAAIADLGPTITAREPWPLTDVYGPGPESTWGPRELLAHISEMLPYWMGEIELILDAGEGIEPPAFGRTEADELRVGIIGRDRGFPARELLARIEVESKRVARRLRALGDGDAELLGRHPRRGDISVREIAESFITSHIEGHVTQLREILAAR